MSTIRNELKAYFDDTKMDAQVNEFTLGQGFEKVSGQALLEASKKLLRINKGEEEPDNRDSLVFKNLNSIEDQIVEHFEASKPSVERKVQNALGTRDKVRQVLPANIFSNTLEKFYTTTDLSSTPPQTNPAAIMSNARKTTVMGEGGIQNQHAITEETRAFNPSDIGFLDGLATPEGLKVGVNVNLASGVRKRGKEVEAPMRMKDGSIEYKTPIEVKKAVVGLPDQKKMVNGKPKPIDDKVKALKDGKILLVDPSEVDFYFRETRDLFDYHSNSVPFLHNTQGNRGSTAGRMLTQALPLDNPEAPLVQSKMDDSQTFEKYIGNALNPTLADETGDERTGGTVKKITNDKIIIQTDKGNEVSVGMFKDFPLNEDGYLNSTPIVEEGEKIQANQPLTKNNYTDDDGTLSVGKNLMAAYLPYKGYSFEDGAVLTESAAEKLSHTTIHKENIYIKPKLSVFNKKKFRAYFPDELDPSNARKLNAEGLPKIGETFQPGELLAAFLVEKQMDDFDKALKRLDRSIYRPYRKYTLEWDSEEPGVVQEVKKNGRNIDIYIKAVHPFKVGDKIANRFGGKNIITNIIPDTEAPHLEDGTPIDIMLNPNGVPGRMNTGQIHETAASRIAQKKGKPYVVENFADPNGNEARKVIKEMKDEGLEPNQTVIDGKSGKPIENKIFAGPQYFMKLRHLVKKKQGAHDFGVYDIEEQPANKTGAQKLGTLESYAYLAHGSKNLLREATTIKGQKNEEYFRDLQFGIPPGKPNSPFVFEKLQDYLRGSGVDTEKKGNTFRIMPLTDKRVQELSNGELEDPGAMLVGKNLTSRKGGLFDPEITGGALGTKYSHISLPNEIPNPMMEMAIRSILDLTKKQYQAIIEGREELDGKKGPKAILAALSGIDVDQALAEAKEELKNAPKTNVNKLNRKVRFLSALKDLNLSPDQAYKMKNMLVIPPKSRPAYPLPSGDLRVSDINKHYRDVGLISKNLKDANEADILDEEDQVNYEADLYRTVKAAQGFIDPITYGKRKYKGALKEIEDTKRGLIFGKAWAKRQDLSGRSTVTAEPSLGLDEIGIPEGIAKKVFSPFVVKDLKEGGMPGSKALKEMRDYTPQAKKALERVMQKKHVVVNRAPSLHKHSVQAFKPKLVTGKDIKVNPLVVSGFNMDFDGDTASVQVPVTKAGEEEAKAMKPSNILFKHGDGMLVPTISHEYAYGLAKLSEKGKRTGKSFSTIKAAREAGLNLTDVFTLNGKEMTIGQHMINEPIPKQLRDYDKVYNKKAVEKLLSEIGKNHQNYFADVINNFKDLGAMYSYKRGMTMSITDLDMDRSFRQEMVNERLPDIEKMEDKSKRIQAYEELVNDLEKEQNKRLRQQGNNIIDLLDTGALSGGKAKNVRQVLTAPGVLLDVKENPIDRPLLKSYAEGLDSADYLTSMPGVRKGIVNKSISTQESGALNKALLNVNRRLVIVEDDCDTEQGITMSVDNPNLIDRAALFSVRGIVDRNDIIDGEVVKKLKENDIEQIKVRSPLTCESVEGVCQMCYGLLPGGNLPSIGTNVGVLDSQAVSERSTQLSLSAFHSGGSTMGGSGNLGSFPRLEQLVKVPQNLSGKATLAPKSGKVEKVEKNDIGGYNVYMEKRKKPLVIAPSRKPLVRPGERVKKGDRLSDGVIKPQELGELKNHLSAQQYIVDELDEIFGGDFHTKTFETMIAGISDNAEVTDAPDDSEFFRGDKTSASRLNKINKERRAEGLEPIKFKSYFKSIDTLNTDNPDWMTRITTNRVKNALQTGAARADYGNIAGKDPIPAYLYGEDFGKPDKKGGEGGFY